MKYLHIAAVAALGIALSGCATIIKGSTQSIVINTAPVNGANCLLSSKEGNWPVVTPGVVKVDKSKDDITVRCTKPGYQEAMATIPSNFQGWTLGNLVLGGVIGLGVDASTGALNEYPHAFTIPMYPTVSGTPASAPMSSMPASPPPGS